MSLSVDGGPIRARVSECNKIVLAITEHTTSIEIDDGKMGETGGSVPDEVVEDEDDKYNYYECK